MINAAFFSQEELIEIGFRKVGRGSRIHKSCIVVGVENISIGDNVRIDGFTSIIASGKGFLNLGSHIHIALNLLKGALDSGKKRVISWLSESSTLRREGIPDRFEFKGSVIFITNLKFDKMKSQKLRDHLDALQSRCHYLDLTLDTMRDKILRIKQIAKDGVLFDGYDFEPETQDSIFEFMETNQARLREMSLRMALKIADLRKLSPDNWRRLAETTCMKVAD